MVKYSFYIREDQLKFIESIPGGASEHIRSALDKYIEVKKRESLNVSESPSKTKGKKMLSTYFNE